MLKNLLIFLIFFNYIVLNGQNNLEQIHIKIKKSSDTAFVNALNELTFFKLRNKIFENIEDTINLAIKQSEQIKYKKGLAEALKLKGTYFFLFAQFDSAKLYYQKSIEIYKILEDYENLAKIYNNLGLIHKNRAEYQQAIDYYNIAVSYAQNINKLDILISLYNNIATIYTYIGDFQRALEKSFEAMKYIDKIKNLGKDDSIKIAYLKITIANIYNNQKKYTEAQNYYFEALKTFEKYEMTNEIADIYLNVGLIEQNNNANNNKHVEYLKKSLSLYSNPVKKALAAYNLIQSYILLDNLDSAKYFLNFALQNYSQINDENGKNLCNLKKGQILIFEKKYNEAIAILEQTKKYAEKIGELMLLNEIYNYLYVAYKNIENYQKALEAHEFYKKINDSLFNINNEKKLVEIALTYKFEKEKEQTELIYQEKLKRQAIIQKFSIALFVVMLFTLIVIYSAFRLKKKKNEELQRLNAEILMQKEEIEAQKEQIEIQAQEIERQRDLAIKRGNELQKKNEDIEASIYYAQRIQQALLPPENIFKQLFKDSFILYKPRDIVSGDFYWVNQRDNLIYLISADCTGHGVPGAFMSVLGVSYCNQIFAENPEIKPAEFLEKLREMVILSLKQSVENTESSRDGMDMALCIIDKNTFELHWAAAYSTSFIVSKNYYETDNEKIKHHNTNGKHFYELKGDRMPIGIYIKEPKKFTSITLKLNKGDKIYLFSDGYEDMFNFEKNQKLTLSRFKEIIINCSDLPMSEQKNFLDQKALEWTGGTKQIDDILVLGIEL